MGKSLYDKLGVDRNASSAEIKDAFKEKAKEHHPDKGGDGKEMAEVNHAYLILRDPVKRDRYDNTGEENEESFDNKFSAFVNAIFMKLVDMMDVEKKDMIELFREQCVAHRKEHEKNKKTFTAKMNKCEKVYKRIGGDERIGNVVKGNIEMFKQEIAKVDLEIKFMKDCEEVIDRHNYLYDKDEQSEVFWTSFNVR